MCFVLLSPLFIWRFRYREHFPKSVTTVSNAEGFPQILDFEHHLFSTCPIGPRDTLPHLMDPLSSFSRLNAGTTRLNEQFLAYFLHVRLYA